MVVTGDGELGFDSGEYNLNPLTRIHWRASLVPAAAVIPAPYMFLNLFFDSFENHGYEPKNRLATGRGRQIITQYWFVICTQMDFALHPS